MIDPPSVKRREGKMQASLRCALAAMEVTEAAAAAAAQPQLWSEAALDRVVSLEREVPLLIFIEGQHHRRLPEGGKRGTHHQS